MYVPNETSSGETYWYDLWNSVDDAEPDVGNAGDDYSGRVIGKCVGGGEYVYCVGVGYYVYAVGPDVGSGGGLYVDGGGPE